jgi:hypothetical protein
VRRRQAGRARDDLARDDLARDDLAYGDLAHERGQLAAMADARFDRTEQARCGPLPALVESRESLRDRPALAARHGVGI